MPSAYDREQEALVHHFPLLSERFKLREIYIPGHAKKKKKPAWLKLKSNHYRISFFCHDGRCRQWLFILVITIKERYKYDGENTTLTVNVEKKKIHMCHYIPHL